MTEIKIPKKLTEPKKLAKNIEEKQNFFGFAFDNIKNTLNNSLGFGFKENIDFSRIDTSKGKVLEEKILKEKTKSQNIFLKPIEASINVLKEQKRDVKSLENIVNTVKQKENLPIFEIKPKTEENIKQKQPEKLIDENIAKVFVENLRNKGYTGDEIGIEFDKSLEAGDFYKIDKSDFGKYANNKKIDDFIQYLKDTGRNEFEINKALKKAKDSGHFYKNGFQKLLQAGKDIVVDEIEATPEKFGNIKDGFSNLGKDLGFSERLPGEEKGFLGKIGDNFSEYGKVIGKSVSSKIDRWKNGKGNLSDFSDVFYEGTGGFLKAGSQSIGDVVTSTLDTVVSEKNEERFKNIAGESMKMVDELSGNNLSKGIKNYNDYKENLKQTNPEEYSKLYATEGILEIGADLIGGKVVKNSVDDVVKNLGKKDILKMVDDKVGKSATKEVKEQAYKEIKKELMQNEVNNLKIAVKENISDFVDVENFGKNIENIKSKIKVPETVKNITSVPKKIYKEISSDFTDVENIQKAIKPDIKRKDNKIIRGDEQIKKEIELAVKHIKDTGENPKNLSEFKVSLENQLKKLGKQIEEKTNKSLDIDITDTSVKLRELADSDVLKILDAPERQRVLNIADELEKKGKISVAEAETMNQFINDTLKSNYSSASQTYKQGLQILVNDLREKLDNVLSDVPGEFKNIKKSYGAIRNVLGDTIKREIIYNRKNPEGLFESFGKMEGLSNITSGLGQILTGNPGNGFSNIGKGLTQNRIGKWLENRNDSNLLIEKAFNNKENKKSIFEKIPKIKKKENIDLNTQKYQFSKNIIDNLVSENKIKVPKKSDLEKYKVKDKEIGKSLNKNKNLQGVRPSLVDYDNIITDYYKKSNKFVKKDDSGKFFYEKVDGNKIFFEKPSGSRIRDLKRRLFKTESNFILDKKFKHYESILDDIQVGKIDKGELAIIPKEAWNDGKSRHLDLTTGIYEKIFKGHGPFDNKDFIVTANQWDYILKNIDGLEGHINIIKIIPGTDKGFLIGAKRENGAFVTTYFEPKFHINDFILKSKNNGAEILTKGKIEAKNKIKIPPKMEEIITQKQAKEIVEKYFKTEEVGVFLVDTIKTKKGQEAFGMYKNKLITFAKDPLKNVPEHEVLHAYFDLAVSPKKQREILDFVKKDKNFKTDLDAEEYLADSFADFVIGRRENYTGISGKIKLFLDDLAFKFKKFFGSEDKVEALFRDLENIGKGKKDFKQINIPNKNDEKYFSKVDDEILKEYDENKFKEFVEYVKEYQKMPLESEIRYGFKEKLSLFNPETRGKIYAIENLIKMEAGFIDKEKVVKIPKKIEKRNINGDFDEETINFVKKFDSGEEMYQKSGIKGNEIFESYGLETKQEKIDFWEKVRKSKNFKEEKKEVKIFTSEVKIDKLYHGTNIKNLDSILKNGFKKGSELGDDVIKGGGYGAKQDSISFSTSPKKASVFGTAYGPEGVVFEVKPTKKLKIARIEGIDYAEELNDYILDLRKKGYDAVDLLDNGEDELVILNSNAIEIIKHKNYKVNDKIDWNKEFKAEKILK